MTHGGKEYLIFPEDVGIYGVMAGAAAVMRGTTHMLRKEKGETKVHGA